MSFFFFNDPATTEIYTLSLHDALPICGCGDGRAPVDRPDARPAQAAQDRKSTRLNSSHGYISYAVFCLKKKKQTSNNQTMTITCSFLYVTTHKIALAKLPSACAPFTVL